MTSDKSLVERAAQLRGVFAHKIGWRADIANAAAKDMEGAAAEIERLEQAKKALAKVIDENHPDPALMAKIIMRSIENEQRAEAAESRLATLLSPSEGAKVSAEERALIRTDAEADKTFLSNLDVLRLLDDLVRATAREREAVETIKKLRMELGYEPDEELIAMAGGSTTMLQAATGPKRDFDPSIRARRKGETEKVT